MAQGGDVAVEAEPGDDANAGVRGHGVLADRLALVDITDVHLDRQGGRCRPSASRRARLVWVNAPGLMIRPNTSASAVFADFIDDEAFVVGLVKYARAPRVRLPRR